MCLNFRKISKITTPVFGLFLPSRNPETLTNSHFQFLKEGNFSRKSAVFEGESIGRGEICSYKQNLAIFAKTIII